MPQTTINEQINQFNEKYQANLSLTELESVARKFQYLDNFLFEKKDKNSALTFYVRGLAKTLAGCIEKQTMINANGVYDLSELHIVGIVNDYEKIMQARYENALAEGEQPARKPYEGAKFEKLLDKLVAFTNSYNKTLPALWANAVKEGKLDVLAMQRITDASNDKLQSYQQQKVGDVVLDEQGQNKLTNVIAAHEAMKAVRNDRGFFWKLFHPIQNYRENRYLQTLTAQRTNLLQASFPVDATLENLGKNVLARAYDNVQQYKIIQARSKAEQQEREVKNANKEQAISITEQLNPIVQAENFQEKLLDELLNACPKGGFPTAAKKGVLQSQMENFIDEAAARNELFDRAVADNGDVEAVLDTHAKEMFMRAYAITRDMGYQNLRDQLLVAQKLADVMMKNLSPATVEQEKYVRYANGYALNNADDLLADLKSTLDYDADEVDIAEQVQQAKQAYGQVKEERVSIQVPEASERESNQQKGEFDQAQPSKQSPVKEV